ncbi:hypothetical protein EC973_001403 [Apophysomyces ossiformis]|uniref:uracil phosphoribosyltransferase n=1 Tax=Apophysomyces ossiformis TaxID=679940 RepID=A0A8H7BP45_9FUNG|nr:hypothetical protein EC973_001403 [Apophysomyces ossiformis]
MSSSATLHISQHPIVATKLSQLREANQPPKAVRELMKDLTSLLAYEASTDLKLSHEKTLQSPYAPYQAAELKDRVALVPVLRSGLGLVDGFLALFPDAPVLHLGLYREKVTLQPVEYYNKLPHNPNVDICFVLDSIIATGNTSVATVNILKEWGIPGPQIKFVSILGSQRGVAHLQEEHPDIHIFVGAVDENLDDKGRQPVRSIAVNKLKTKGGFHASYFLDLDSVSYGGSSKQNLLQDGQCHQINQLQDGWQTRESDDWMYYRQQYVEVYLSDMNVTLATVGGCCAPNRHKPSGFVYEEEHGQPNDTRIVRIADEPLIQRITVEGWYMKQFVDDHAMNLTLLASINIPDKQSILYSVAINRAMLVNYQFLDKNNVLIRNYTSPVLRQVAAIPDVTLPRGTRSIILAFYGSRANPMCFTYIYAGLYVNYPAATLTRLCSTMSSILQYLALFNFVLIPSLLAILTSRIANLLGIYVTLVLCALRVFTDLPSYVITYARDHLFLVINTLTTLPTAVAFIWVLLYFLVRLTCSPCDLCRLAFLEVDDIEEQYVKSLIGKKFQIEVSSTKTEFCVRKDKQLTWKA